MANHGIQDLIQRAYSEEGIYASREYKRGELKRQICSYKQQMGNLESVYPTPSVDELVELRNQLESRMVDKSLIKFIGGFVSLCSIPAINVIAYTLGPNVGVDVPLLSSYVGIYDTRASLWFSGIFDAVYGLSILPILYHRVLKSGGKLEGKYGKGILDGSSLRNVKDEIKRIQEPVKYGPR